MLGGFHYKLVNSEREDRTFVDKTKCIPQKAGALIEESPGGRKQECSDLSVVRYHSFFLHKMQR